MQNYSKSPIRVFFSFYKPHATLFMGDMICATFISAIDVAFPIISKYTIDSIIPSQNVRFFFILMFSLVGCYVIRRVCSWFVAYWGHVFGTRVEADMRRDIFDHLENQSFSFFDQNRTGKLMSRVTIDLFEVTELAHHGPEDVWTSVLTILGSFVLLVRIRWELAVIVLVFVLAVLCITVTSRKKLMETSKRVKETTADINAVLESSISGIRVTKVFTNEAYEKKRFEDGNIQFCAAKQKYYKHMADFHANIEFFNHILNVIVLAAGGYFIIQGSMSISDLVAANLFISAFTQPVRKLTNFVEQFTTGIAGFSRFLEIMKHDTSIKNAPNATELTHVHGDIHFNHVSFSYNEDFPVLEDINLDIKAGKTQAFVGSSGGGKTTICSLLPRFYETTSGTITLDGIDIRTIKLENLRKQIGIVQQDVFLFAGTIRENIAYGKIGATDAEIEDAAKRAEIHDDIMRLPAGYDTLVGERGIKLSGGQKQRISIARCFLKNPPVLILDEATSALDSATEIKIQKAFDALAKGRTTLVIAHRLSTVKNADSIAVVDDKGISESGTHEELMARGSFYKTLYDTQYQ